MYFMLHRRTILALIFISCLTLEVTPATPAHIHQHHSSKERAEDGAFISRDHDHMLDGQHRSEFDHEAILGSVKDAEEFDHLSPEESKRRLRILLDKMDLNKDQNIDRNELRAWILRSFKMLSEEESAERFEDADENQDNKVSWEEYVSDTFGGFDGSNEVDHLLNSDEETQMMRHDKILFQAADKNQDGFLDKSEFVLFTHPEEHPEMLPLVLKNTLEEKDKNKDESIDFQEFLGDRAKNHDKEWLITEKDRFDRDYDKNNDGKLSGNEILSWMFPSNDEIAQEEVVHLFESADDDNNNLLSFDEVLENYDTFVGSEVTDYGEHLQNIHTFQDEL